MGTTAAAVFSAVASAVGDSRELTKFALLLLSTTTETTPTTEAAEAAAEAVAAVEAGHGHGEELRMLSEEETVAPLLEPLGTHLVFKKVARVALSAPWREITRAPLSGPIITTRSRPSGLSNHACRARDD